MSKRILSLVLALVMVFCLVACGGDVDPNPSAEPSQSGNNTDNTPAIDYTYNGYSESLGTNWNPHTWEMNADQSIQSYILAPLTDLTVKDSTTGEYQWIFVAAESVTDVTADHQDDLVKYGCAETDATEGYVYEIKLRPEMKWEDGTPINADTYVYSMQQMLDPKMKNYRANNYYSGESAVAGARAYFNQGAPIYDVVVPAYGEGEDPDYSLDITANDIYVKLDTTGMTIAGYSFYEICNDYGYIEGDVYNAVAEHENIYGYVPVNEDTVDAVQKMMDQYLSAFGMSLFNEDGTVVEELYKEFLFYDTGVVGEAVSFDQVGLYKVDDYTIRYVCEVAYDYYYFLTSCTSNWIVHEGLYEKCKDTSGELVTSTYNTSAETTLSCYAYRIESLQDEKQLVFVQNENYWEYTKNDDGSLSSTTFFEVDGEKKPQFQTQKIVIDVMTSDAAKLAFLSGKLDDWTPAADEVVEYSTSDQLYQVDETYTMRLFFHTNLDSLKKMDEAGNTNSVVMSNYNFRKAMSLAINRAEFVSATAGYKPAYSMLNSLYFYDVYEDPASIYRNTDEAKQAIVNLYEVKYGEGEIYKTLDEAYNSITGYNQTEAKALFTEACKELVADGLYKEGDPIVIEMGWMAGAMDSSNSQQVTLLNKYMNEAMAGTGFGTIELKAIDNLAKRYEDVYNGVYAIGWGAWGGAAFYPFTMFQVYCDDDYVSYIHEGGCWNPAVETLTLNVKGEDVTMTWKEWSGCMAGTGKYAGESNEVKLAILAGIEENFLKLYYCIPVCATTICSMMSYKISNYTDNYSIMYGFGGLRLQQHNYTDAEWADYVASQNGTLSY